MSEAKITRARGCLLGLAAGDALGGPTEGKTRQAIAQKWGRVTDFLSDDQSGSDDTEYALFNARMLLEGGGGLTPENIAERWKKDIIGTATTYKGAGFSEMMAIRNLRAGLPPPISGQHIHAWSDGLAMRVAPFAIVAAGHPHRAAQLAAMDGSVTHAGEGIYAGQAVAAAMSDAMTGAFVLHNIDAARSVIPEDSWTRRAIDCAVAVASRRENVWEALLPLSEELVCQNYHWPDLAPEAVGLAFGLLVAARGDYRDAVLGGVNIGRDTDTIAGIAGGIAGARQGVAAIPPPWIQRVRFARGVCLSIVAGMNIEETADRLAAIDLFGEDPA